MEVRHRKRVGEYGKLNKCVKKGVKEKALPVTELSNTILE